MSLLKLSLRHAPSVLLPLVLPLLQIATLATADHSSPSLCQQVAAKLPGRLSYSGSAVYNSSQATYFTGEERDLAPACVFRPTCASDVAQVVQLVAARHQAQQSPPDFAFRCGGHSYFAGAANVGGGLTVDLRSLNSFQLSADKKTASVGGGSIWSDDVYPNLIPHDLAVSGGRIPGVGVGGFVTGGGLNFLERRNGFGCDNVYGYEVVLGTGQIVYASADSHRDLWLALKGGTNNFGIVTRFDLATHPQGLMLGGFIGFNATQSTIDAHAKAFSNWMDPKNFDPLAVIEVIFGWANGVWSLSDAIYYLEPNLTPRIYQEFLSIPGQTTNTLALKNISGVVEESGELVPETVSRGVQLSFSFKNANASIYSQLFQVVKDAVDPISHVEGLLLEFFFQPLPVTNGTNSLGLSPNVTDRVVTDIGLAYNNAADDSIIAAALQGIYDRQVHILKAAGLFLDFTYLNYAGPSQDPIGSYGTRATLQAVSKKYDPQGFFQKAVPGPWKLFN